MDYKKKYESLVKDLEQLIEKYNKPVSKTKIEELKKKAAAMNFDDLEKRGE